MLVFYFNHKVEMITAMLDRLKVEMEMTNESENMLK